MIELVIGLTVLVAALTLAGGVEAPPRAPKRAGELDRPRTRAGAASDREEVKVVAVLQRRGETTSPVGDRRCVAWRLEVERFERGVWSSVLDHTFVGALDAIDGDVTVRLREESEVVVSWPDEPPWVESSPDALLTQLAEAGAPTDDVDLRRWRERLLRAGDRIAVLGTARWRVEAADYRAAARELELGNRGRLPLLLSARPEHLR